MPIAASAREEPHRFDEEDLDRLAPRERRLVQLRFGLVDGKERTLSEVARRFRLTEEEARLLLAGALRKLSG